MTANPGKGGKVSLFVDKKLVGEGTVAATAPILLSGEETCDVGADYGGAVSPDYGPRGNAFNGEVRGVAIDIAEAAGQDVTPEERVRVAMARQ